MTDFLQRIARHRGRKASETLDLDKQFRALLKQATQPVPPSVLDKSDPGSLLKMFSSMTTDNLFKYQEISDISPMVESLQQSPLPVYLADQPSLKRLLPEQLPCIQTDNFQQPCIAVVHADVAIAETGTVVLDSTQVPSALLFLAEELVILVDKKSIVPFMEDCWSLRAGHSTPRAVHWISGPSRTADVEQTLQVGAHGPRQVWLWLVA